VHLLRINLRENHFRCKYQINIGQFVKGFLDMRKYFVAMASLVAISVAASANAETTKKVDYDCALFNECANDSDIDRGKTKGFSMAGTAAPAPVARPAVKSAPVAAARRPTQMAMNTRTAPAAPVSAASGVDLALNFVTGSSDLTPGARASANRLAAAMMRPDRLSTRFVIEGHTDAVGTRESNLDLSRRRADAVVSYLKAKGVDSKRFEIYGYGFDRPISGLSALNGANRRVVAKPIK
jgi:OmpA-OmpF porin, OOP family